MVEQCILVVEDDEMLLELLQRLLTKEGYVVLGAHNGTEALAKMIDHRPDAIIADIMMPHMDGYTFYSAVRARQEWVAIPFIFLTAKDGHDDVMKGKGMGAEEYITKPVTSEDLLLLLRARLRRSTDIQQAVEQDTEQLKRQIVNSLSHELRTPLTFISGYTDLALSGATELPDPQFREFLLGVKQGTDRLTILVQGLLMVFELDAGIISQNFDMGMIRHEDLSLIATAMVTRYESEARYRRVTLDGSGIVPVPPVYINELFFPDTLGNLISNGIKFSTNKDARVCVSTEADDQWVKIKVADNGIGIAPGHIRYLFEPFRQINRDKIEQQGVGIGLYVAREIIRLHGGDITVTSRLGVGSTFTIHLPRSK